jgi:hypothetical protein
MRHAIFVVLVTVSVALLAGCGKRELAPEPIDTTIVNECFRPFFDAADQGDVEAMKRVLTRETVAYYEGTVFQEGRVMETWEEFVRIHQDRNVSKFVKEVIVEGDRATVRDVVGGRFKCVRQDGRWKADLTR